MVQQTMDKLHDMRLPGMAKAFEEQLSLPTFSDMSFEDRFGMVVETEFTYRENKKLERRLKTARLKRQSSVENINYKHPRGLDKSVMQSLINCQWIKNHNNVVIIGPTGIGKSYISEALANKSCRIGYTALFQRAPEFFTDLEIAKEDGTRVKLMRKIKKVDVLVLDDFLMKPMNDDARHDFLEIMEDRYDKGSIVLTSQYPIVEWHTLIGAPTIADAILDRIVHNSHRITLDGESMRKSRSIIS